MIMIIDVLSVLLMMMSLVFLSKGLWRNGLISVFLGSLGMSLLLFSSNLSMLFSGIILRNGILITVISILSVMVVVSNSIGHLHLIQFDGRELTK